MRPTIIFSALLLATSLSAGPVITSVTPNRGPVDGGTKVTIKGSGFSNNCIVCSPPFATPEVYFFETPAASVTLIDANTLEAITPPHLPATVPVRVHQFDGSEPFTLQDAFSFEGNPNTAFDPILFPIFTGPVRGQFDSEFHTRARVWNQDLFNPVRLYGVDTNCYLFTPTHDPLMPFNLQQSGAEQVLLPDCSTSIGRLFWVPKGTDTLAANLRVTDVTRQASSHGVEIPVVHRNDFSEERISLLGVPIDARFRNTLRIYSLARGEVLINLSIGEEGRQVWLPAAQSWFEPAVLTFTDFPLPAQMPPGQQTIRVVVDAPRGGVNIPGTPIWAFITVTNNETQQITTITPN